MKKVLSIVLLCVFAFSFVASVSVTETKAMPDCIATCDTSVGLWWICCPETRGKSGKIWWVCEYGNECWF